MSWWKLVFSWEIVVFIWKKKVISEFCFSVEKKIDYTIRIGTKEKKAGQIRIEDSRKELFSRSFN